MTPPDGEVGMVTLGLSQQRYSSGKPEGVTEIAELERAAQLLVAVTLPRRVDLRM